jgi:hypothetical protein
MAVNKGQRRLGFSEPVKRVQLPSLAFAFQMFDAKEVVTSRRILHYCSYDGRHRSYLSF